MKIIRPLYDPRHLFGTCSVQYLALFSILITHDTQVGLLTGSTPAGMWQATMVLKSGPSRKTKESYRQTQTEESP